MLCRVLPVSQNKITVFSWQSIFSKLWEDQILYARMRCKHDAYEASHLTEGDFLLVLVSMVAGVRLGCKDVPSLCRVR